MRRWFKSTRTYIFVAPVAVVMADEGGCASSSHEAMDRQQVEATLIGNTIFNEEGSFAYLDTDGTIRAEISATDAIKVDSGSWSLDDSGSFCVDWTETILGKDSCAEFVQLEDDQVQWGGHTLSVQPGNPKEL